MQETIENVVLDEPNVVEALKEDEAELLFHEDQEKSIAEEILENETNGGHFLEVRTVRNTIVT